MLRTFSSALIALFSTALACSAAPPGTGESGEPTPADIEAANEGVKQVTQALGEPTCGSTAPVASISAVGSVVVSPNGSYDPPTCRNAFVVDARGLAAGENITAGYPTQSNIDPFTCLFRYGALSLWKLQGASYVKVGETLGLGALVPARFAYVCVARATLTVPSAGDYKVAAAAGTLFGPTSVVNVFRGP
jgi:hypothetical protein